LVSHNAAVQVTGGERRPASDFGPPGVVAHFPAEVAAKVAELDITLPD
jgi:hypothetical protein